MLKALLLPIALLAAACSPPATETAAKSEMSEMKMEEPAAPASPASPIRATGTVTAVNAAQGTITLNHEPIPSIQWSAMTMEFKAEDPRILQGIAVGDRVTFELKNTTETNTITMVQKQ